MVTTKLISNVDDIDNNVDWGKTTILYINVYSLKELLIKKHLYTTIYYISW